MGQVLRALKPSLCGPSGCPGLASDAQGPSQTGGKTCGGVMTQAEWGSDQTPGALLSVWAGRPLHREPQTNQDSAALPPGRRGRQGAAWAEEGPGQTSQR